MNDHNKHKIQTGGTGYHLRVLDETWNNQLIKISEGSPVRTRQMEILFDRAPDIFTIPKLTSYRYRCLGLFKEDQIIGFVIACYQKRYIQGELTDVIYLGNMHVTQKGAGSIFLEKLTKRYRSIIPNQTPVKYWYAYVMDTNRAAMRLADLGKLHSQVAGKISMSLIFLPNSIRNVYRHKVREASEDDIDQIVALLQDEYSQRFLAPEINRKIFLQNLRLRPNFSIQNYLVAEAGDTIIGTCAIWDMTAFKKHRMISYSIGTGIIRKLVNGAAYISGKPQLPKAGEAFKDATITEYAVKDQNPDILNSLLYYAYEKYRSQKYHYLIFGYSPEDPLKEALHSFITKDVSSYVIIGSGQKSEVDRLNGVNRIHADSIQI